MGVTIHESLNHSVHIANGVNQANRALGIIRGTYDYKSKENVLRLYKSRVIPHLDYCVQAWRQYKTCDMNNVESGQRRALKLSPGLMEIPYEDMRSRTKLMSLERRRLMVDLIEMSKLIRGYDYVDR